MTLYLSRLTLDRRTSSRAIAPLLDPDDRDRAADAHHRLIWTAFGDREDRKRDFLWRAEGRGRFYTLSRRAPQTDGLFEPPEVKPFEPDLRVGDRLAFVLRANATKDRARGQLAPDKRDRRVDLVMDLLRDVPADQRAEHRDAKAQEAAIAWMGRQGDAKGFRPLDVVVESYATLSLDQRRRGATLGILDLSGRIEVVEPDAFVAALGAGFGRAKAWGCGLMMIRRAA